jgi:hypothetical protein
VRRSLSLIFGDGKGGYPEGAWLDCIQIHNLTAQDDVDMIYKGLNDPGAPAPWLGALAALLDLRDGTNRSGTNPKNEKLVRHIGITGHYNPAAHIAAIQRDEKRILDTLLVAYNPTDRFFFPHRYTSIPVAHAAGMGVIAMKVFVDASYYGAPATFVRDPANVFLKVGEKPVESKELIQFVLSPEEVTCCITGIGHIDDDPKKCQLVSNLAAAQVPHRLPPDEVARIEKEIAAAGYQNVNAFLQRTAIGLTPPRNPGAESDTAGFSPATPQPRPAIRISWDTAYAGAAPIRHYEVIRDGELIATVPHKPQINCERFFYEDVFAPQPEPAMQNPPAVAGQACEGAGWIRQRSASDETCHSAAVGSRSYVVRAVDAAGNQAETAVMTATP